MADAQDSVTTVDEPQDKKKGRFGFGRRKDKEDDTRSETEWVDTLRADEEALPEEHPAISPFAAPETEPEPEHDPSALSALPEAPHEEAPQEQVHEDELGPEAAAASNGDTESVYEKSWTRRRHEEMDDIHHFVDNVIGTSLDPARRRRLMSHEVGLHNQTVQREKPASPIRVEGIDEELMVAFTFPPEEFRGARVVYETEGGYVLEVQRAVQNDDKRTTHQYYTVSRVGEVAHVLDKMRAREIERDHAALQRTVETERHTTTTRSTTTSTPRLPEPEPVESLPEQTTGPDTGGEHDITTEALPESFTEPSGDHGAGSVPEVDRVATPPPRPEPEAAPRPSEAPQVDVADTTVPPAEEAPAEEAPAEGPSKRGRFGRKRDEDAGEPERDAGADDEPKRGLFGRKKDVGDVDETPDGSSSEEEPSKRGLFGRRKTDVDEPTDADTDADADADDPESRKRGIFRFKKGSDADEEDA